MALSLVDHNSAYLNCKLVSVSHVSIDRALEFRVTVRVRWSGLEFLELGLEFIRLVFFGSGLEYKIYT